MEFILKSLHIYPSKAIKRSTMPSDCGRMETGGNTLKAQLIRLTLMRAMSLHIAREAPFNHVPQLTASFDFLEHLNTVLDLPRKHLARKLSKEARASRSWVWGISQHSLWPIKPHTQVGQIIRWKEFLIKVMIRFITSNHNSLTRKKSKQVIIMQHYLPKAEFSQREKSPNKK